MPYHLICLQYVWFSLLWSTIPVGPISPFRPDKPGRLDKPVRPDMSDEPWPYRASRAEPVMFDILTGLPRNGPKFAMLCPVEFPVLGISYRNIIFRKIMHNVDMKTRNLAQITPFMEISYFPRFLGRIFKKNSLPNFILSSALPSCYI